MEAPAENEDRKQLDTSASRKTKKCDEYIEDSVNESETASEDEEDEDSYLNENETERVKKRISGKRVKTGTPLHHKVET